MGVIYFPGASQEKLEPMYRSNSTRSLGLRNLAALYIHAR